MAPSLHSVSALITPSAIPTQPLYPFKTASINRGATAISTTYLPTMCDFYLADKHETPLKGKFAVDCSRQESSSSTSSNYRQRPPNSKSNANARTTVPARVPSPIPRLACLPGSLFRSKLNAVIDGALAPIPEHPLTALTSVLPKFSWRLDFPQPVVDYSQFQQRLLANSIALETAEISTNPGDQSDSLSGVVRVLNRSSKKRVFVRVTADEWDSFGEAEASYRSTTQSFTENFSFRVPLRGAAEVGRADSGDSGCRL